MLFNSLVFLIFLPTVLLLYRLSDHRRQNLLLLAASYVFYGWWDWRFLSLLAISTIVDYFCGAAIASSEDPKRRLLLLRASLATNLGILGFFKYFNFFADSAARLLDRLGLEASPTTLDIVLPVGISFYTFQTLSYTIDIYRRKAEPCRRWTDFALYVSFFPQLVAGPIERSVALIPQIERRRAVSREQTLDGLSLIAIGYVKKLVIADRCARLVNVAFAGEALAANSAAAWLALYAFAFQIYGDFSGYTDIARGVSKLFGFELMRNFRAPYFVTGPSAFWQHWHISLSTWLRDYLYIPLGGNRGGSARTYRNLMLTMTLGGLWHGAGWAYLIWGFYHGLLLIVHRTLSPALDRLEAALRRVRGASLAWRAASLLTFFHLTCLGWLIFRAGSIGPPVDQAEFLYRSLASLTAPPSLAGAAPLLRVALFTGLLTALFQWKADACERFHAWSPDRQALAVCASLASIVALGVFDGADFIYFQF